MNEELKEFPRLTDAQCCIISVVNKLGCSTTQEIADELGGISKRRVAAAIASCTRSHPVISVGDGAWSVTLLGARTFLNREL